MVVHGQVEMPLECPRGIGAELQWPNGKQHLFGQHPLIYNYAIPIAGVCLLVTSIISIRQLCRLSAPQAAGPAIPNRVRQTRTVVAVPLVIAAFKFASLVAPRIWKLLFLVAAVYEVFAFWSLMQLILGFVAASFDEVVEVLSELADAKMWAVLPFTYVFRPCVQPRAPRRQDLLVIRSLVWQFVVIVPLVAAAEITETSFLPHLAHELLPKLEAVSLGLAMFGIFSLLEATHTPLEDRRTHAKFWTVKGTFIANMFTFRVSCALLHDDVKVGGNCYTSETVATAWSGLIAAVLTVPLALLGVYAYPEDDLNKKYYKPVEDQSPSKEV